MKISELTDVELNRAMIWLYMDEIDTFSHNWFQQGLEELSRDYQNILDDGKSFTVVLGEWEWDVNFLSGYLSWDLTMPLAVENGLILELSPHSGNYAGNEDYGSFSKKPLRAICEVLVMIKLGEK